MAYATYRQFQSERGVLSSAADNGQPVFTFGWRFFVPADSTRFDQDLLREAVELANTDEVKEWRRAVKRWRHKSMLRGQSDAEALQDMEEMVKAYQSAARNRKILVATRYGQQSLPLLPARSRSPSPGRHCSRRIRPRDADSAALNPQTSIGRGHVLRSAETTSIAVATVLAQSCPRNWRKSDPPLLAQATSPAKF